MQCFCTYAGVPQSVDLSHRVAGPLDLLFQCRSLQWIVGDAKGFSTWRIASDSHHDAAASTSDARYWVTSTATLPLRWTLSLNMIESEVCVDREVQNVNRWTSQPTAQSTTTTISRICDQIEESMNAIIQPDIPFLPKSSHDNFKNIT